jgi:hypothetical protein
MSETSVSAQDAPGGQSGGPMTVERVRDGWAVAPDVKFTQFDHQTRTLAGGYGGKVIADQFFIGAAGYWLTDPSRAHELSYGGALVEWRERTAERIGFSVKGLFGFGSATVSRDVFVLPFVDVDHPATTPPVPPMPQTVRLAFREDFLVAEPQADVILNLSRYVHVHAGVGYRAVSASRGSEHQIQGATGGISFEIGPSSRP